MACARLTRASSTFEKESKDELEVSEGNLGKQKEQFSKASLIPIQSEELISSWKQQSL